MLQELTPNETNLTVLIVDDDETNRNALSNLLKRHFNKCITSKDGAEGLEIFKTLNIDVVITDLNMPQIDGLEMSKAIKIINKDVPIIAVSGIADINYLLRAIDIGIDKYLIKPVKKEKLFDVISQIKQDILGKRELEKTRRDLINITNAMGEGLLVLDNKLTVTYANNMAASILGFSKEELLALPYNVIIHCNQFNTKHFTGDKCPIQEVSKTCIPYSTQNGIFITKAGRRCNVSYSATPLIKDDKISSVVIVFKDTSELNKTKEALKESENKYHTLFNSGGDGIFVASIEQNPQQQTFYEVNDILCSRLEYTKNELMKLNPVKISASEEDNASQEMSIIIERMKKENSVLFESKHKTKSGKIIPVETHARIIAYDNKTAMLALARDMTERILVKEQLNASERRYRNVVDNINIGIAVIDRNMKILSFNKQIGAWFHHIKSGLHSYCYNMYKISDNANSCQSCPAVRTFLDGNIYSTIIDNLTDKEVKHYKIITTPLRDENGEISSIIELVEDITEQWKAQAALKDRELRYRTIINSTIEGFWQFNINGEISEANASLCNMLGYEKHEIIGKTPFFFMDRENRKIFNTEMVKLIYKPYSTFEITLKTKNSSKLHGIIGATKLIGIEHRNDTYFTFITNISELKEAQEKLNRHRQLLNSVTEAVIRLINIHDLEQAIESAFTIVGEALKVNRMYICELTNKHDEDYITLRYYWNKSGDDRNIVLSLDNLPCKANEFETLLYVLTQGRTVELTVSNMTDKERNIFAKDGVKSVMLFPITIHNILWGILGIEDKDCERNWSAEEKSILLSITTSIEGAIERDIQNKALEKLNATLEQRIEDEVNKNREKDHLMFQQARYAQMGEVLSMIAHQWRQPLSAISTASIELSIKSSLDIITKEGIHEVTRFIELQTQKMSSTINDFMNFFKPEKEKEKFLLNDVIDEIRDLMQAQLKFKEVNLINSLNDEIYIIGFKKELEQVMINIVTNARDAYEDKENNNKTINISASKKDKNVVIEIEDRAGGISENIINRIFDPYFSTKHQGKGTGIGLYMSKNIIERRFNGTLKAEKIENGSVFTIIIPEENNGRTSKQS
ncbi:Signal transduction response regulator, receiver region [Candidatus Magnetoovum chiemensis]|nr:Signal transduction response regulator, receiver region [Candidatus Magnetoovum chiemensis]